MQFDIYMYMYVDRSTHIHMSCYNTLPHIPVHTLYMYVHVHVHVIEFSGVPIPFYSQ